MSEAPKNIGKFAGVSLLVIGTWVVANGEKLGAVATVFWKWLLMVFAEMPASWASLLAGWGCGLAVMYALRRWIPDPGMGRRWNNTRMALIELTSGAAAFMVVAMQVPSVEKAFLPLVFALIVALTVSASYRIIGAIAELVARRVNPTGACDEKELQQAGAPRQDAAREADG